MGLPLVHAGKLHLKILSNKFFSYAVIFWLSHCVLHGNKLRMDSTELTSLTLRLPVHLRERLEKQAAGEERTLSQFIRFHLAHLLEAASAPKPKSAADLNK